MRLDHLEEQPLRSKKSAQKPPKIVKKSTNASQAQNIPSNTNLSLTSASDESQMYSSNGFTTNSEGNSTERAQPAT